MHAYPSLPAHADIYSYRRILAHMERSFAYLLFHVFSAPYAIGYIMCALACIPFIAVICRHVHMPAYSCPHGAYVCVLVLTHTGKLMSTWSAHLHTYSYTYLFRPVFIHRAGIPDLPARASCLPATTPQHLYPYTSHHFFVSSYVAPALAVCHAGCARPALLRLANGVHVGVLMTVHCQYTPSYTHAGIYSCRRIVAHMERTHAYLCLQNNVRRRMHMPAGTRWPTNTHVGVSSPTWSVHRRTSSYTCSMHPVP